MTKEEAIKSLFSKGFEFKNWSIPKDGEPRVILECSCTPGTVHELDTLCENKEGE